MFGSDFYRAGVVFVTHTHSSCVSTLSLPFGCMKVIFYGL